jgi:hypothetical protein
LLIKRREVEPEIKNPELDLEVQKGLERERLGRESLVAKYTDDDLMQAWWYGFMAAREEKKEDSGL